MSVGIYSYAHEVKSINGSSYYRGDDIENNMYQYHTTAYQYIFIRYEVCP